jgi:hypothetical protein
MGLFSGIGKIIGDITGTNAAADAQTNAANQAAQLQKQMFDQTQANLNPFMKAGQGALPGLTNLLKPIDEQQALQDFYGSEQYALMGSEAQNNLLAASEAMGGMGNTSTGNSLKMIAPNMGQQHLGQLYARQADDFNRHMGVVNMGQNAAANLGNAGQNYASQAGNAYQQAGQAQAQKAMAPFQTVMGLSQLGVNAAKAGLF